ncbi:MAG: chromate efflux transporter [Desulfovibrionaceae bacterium]
MEQKRSHADLVRPTLSELFGALLRLGSTAFGGPAMVPHIRRLAVERRAWLSEEQFQLGMAVAQLVPGATAMQVAAYVGLRARGGMGALLAYIGFALPAFLLMLALSVFYFQSRDVAWVASTFSGLKVVVTALVTHAALSFSGRYLVRARHMLLALAAGFWLGLGGNPIPALVFCCVSALILFRNEPCTGGACGGDTGNVGWGPGLGAAVFLVLGLAALFWLNRSLFDLSAMMVRIDCFAFGGGYVSLPLMLHEVVSRGIMGESMLMDGIALGQITPGPIVMTSAFVGYAVFGVVGAFLATVFVFAPSFLFLALAVPLGDRLAASPLARRAFQGSLVGLVGLMAAMAARFVVAVPWGPVETGIGLAALVALWRGVDIVWVVLAGAVVSALAL